MGIHYSSIPRLPRRPFIVEVDALDGAVGVILSQKVSPKRELHLCAFFFQQLAPTETNYNIWDKLLLAIKAAFHLLKGAKDPTVLLTDHHSLEYY